MPTMTNEDPSELRRAVIDPNRLPSMYPTHLHDSSFWEALGRAVATYGFLEEVLGKAIFAFTATRTYSESNVDEAYANWLPKLERALSNPLGNLIDVYGKSVRSHAESTITNLDELVDNLRKAAEIRNVLCHGSWRPPSAAGASKPFFVNKQMMIFDSDVDVAYLSQVQTHVTDLSISVINSVTHMGWQFPGGAGPGKAIWK